MPRSSALDIGGLLALRALHDVEGNFFAFLEGFETTHGNSGEMGEEIFAAIIRSNKAKAFGIIEPLDGTECHINYFHTKKTNQTPVQPDSLFEFNAPVRGGNFDTT